MDVETFRDYALSIDRIKENFCKEKIKFDKWTDYLLIKTHKYLDFSFRFILRRILKRIIIKNNESRERFVRTVFFHVLISFMYFAQLTEYMHGKKENYCFVPETIIYLSLINSNPKLKLISEPMDILLLQGQSAPICLVN